MYDEIQGKVDCYANHRHINLFSCPRYHLNIVNTELDCIGQKKNALMQNIFHYYPFFLKRQAPRIQLPRHHKKIKPPRLPPGIPKGLP